MFRLILDWCMTVFALMVCSASWDALSKEYSVEAMQWALIFSWIVFVCAVVTKRTTSRFLETRKNPMEETLEEAAR